MSAAKRMEYGREPLTTISSERFMYLIDGVDWHQVGEIATQQLPYLS